MAILRRSTQNTALFIPGILALCASVQCAPFTTPEPAINMSVLFDQTRRLVDAFCLTVQSEQLSTAAAAIRDIDIAGLIIPDATVLPGPNEIADYDVTQRFEHLQRHKLYLQGYSASIDRIFNSTNQALDQEVSRFLNLTQLLIGQITDTMEQLIKSGIVQHVGGSTPVPVVSWTASGDVSTGEHVLQEIQNYSHCLQNDILLIQYMYRNNTV